MRLSPLSRLLAALFAPTLLASACGSDDPVDTVVGAMAVDDTAVDDTAADDTAADDTAVEDVAGDDTDHDMDHDADHEMDHDADHDMSHGDHGEPIEWTGDVVPTVDVEVVADPAGGVDIHVDTTGYRVAPEAASTEHVAGEGHFHLWVDGEKKLRFYNDSIYYSGVTEGDVEIAVELSANDHSPYSVDGELLIESVLFTVPEHAHDEHSHDDPAPVEFVGPQPSLSVEVVEDPKSGWNAFITHDGLALSGEHASGDPVDGEGHLHIYANGQKIGRLYGGATHVAALPDGEVEIRVAAYSNDHRPYVVDGAPVEATTTVTVST